MPLELKDKEGKKTYAVAIVGDRTRCGQCDMPVLDGQYYYMLDAPYQCMVHEACMRFFQYDGKARCAESKGRKEDLHQINADEKLIGEYMSRSHFKTRVPPAVRDAWIRVFEKCLVTRQNYGCEIRGRTLQTVQETKAQIEAAGESTV